MAIFDDPFDAERDLSPCACGRHRSAAEHEQARLKLRCEPADSDDKRYERLVAAAAMRAVFPRDAARRAFLQSVGASTALAQFFPLKTATEAFAHMLAPMPIAITLGLGAQPIPFVVPAIENINGQGITLALKHKNRRNPAARPATSS